MKTIEELFPLCHSNFVRVKDEWGKIKDCLDVRLNFQTHFFVDGPSRIVTGDTKKRATEALVELRDLIDVEIEKLGEEDG